jgi:nicotinamidase/pyrazinamidase
MQALLLFDLQNDFMPGGALGVLHGDQTVPVANRCMRLFPLIVATQDWHPPNHKSFVTENPGHRVGDVIDLDGLTQTLWPVHCVQNTRGAALHPDLDAERIARIFYKGTNPRIDSYSGFFDNAHRQDTGLGAYLRERDVDSIVALGLATDYCVRASCLDARALGFDVTVVLEGCRPVELEPGDGARALAELERAGVHLLSEAQLSAK